MALSQSLWSLNSQQPLSPSGLLSEFELEETLHKNIELLNPDWLVIGRQIRTANGKYLDLLCIDQDEDLVVVELKKDLTPREVTAQVIEYASYMAEKEPKDLAQIYLDYAAKYLHTDTTLDQAYKNKFGVELDEEQVNQNIKMVLCDIYLILDVGWREKCCWQTIRFLIYHMTIMHRVQIHFFILWQRQNT